MGQWRESEGKRDGKGERSRELREKREGGTISFTSIHYVYLPYP